MEETGAPMQDIQAGYVCSWMNSMLDGWNNFSCLASSTGSRMNGRLTGVCVWMYTIVELPPRNPEYFFSCSESGVAL